MVGFRCLGVRFGGAEAGMVAGVDLEQHPQIRKAETAWLARALSLSHDSLHKLEAEMKQLDTDIRQVQDTLAMCVCV